MSTLSASGMDPVSYTDTKNSPVTQLQRTNVSAGQPLGWERVTVMSSLFVEAFGQLIRGANPGGFVSEDEENLYSVFRARAELMGWYTTSPRRRPLLWGVHEAELTAGVDAPRIGFVQVGLEVGDLKQTRTPPPLDHRGFGYAPSGIRRKAIEPVLMLPALIQCLDDALRRFGAVELSGLQVTANFLQPGTQSCAGDLVGTLNWFNTNLKGKTGALVAFDQELLGGYTEAELVADLQRGNTGSFEFGPVVAVSDHHSIKLGVEAPFRYISPAHSGLGVSVTLPEWTAGAAGWALAVVIDAARVNAPDVSHFTVRVTRVR